VTRQTADLPLPLRQRRERCTALLPPGLVGAIRRSSLWTDIVTVRFDSALAARGATSPAHESPCPEEPSHDPGRTETTGHATAAHPRNGLGITALVLSVVAIIASITVIGGILLEIIAVVLGFIARSRAKKGQATNGGVALAGIITSALGVVLSIVLVAAGAALFFGNGGSDLVTCINNAHGDQTAINHCNDQFQNKVRNGN